jgi:hypothetical protein
LPCFIPLDHPPPYPTKPHVVFLKKKKKKKKKHKKNSQINNDKKQNSQTKIIFKKTINKNYPNETKSTQNIRGHFVLPVPLGHEAYPGVWLLCLVTLK